MPRKKRAKISGLAWKLEDRYMLARSIYLIAEVTKNFCKGVNNCKVGGFGFGDEMAN